MKRWFLFFGLLSAGIQGVCAISGPVDFSRYQVILDRKPFGSETPPAGAAGSGMAAAAVKVDPFVKFIKISAFVRDDFSPIIRVGLVDTRSNQSYLLAEGESADGIKLISAEFESERVLISKDNEAYWLTMDGIYTLEVEAGPKPEGVKEEIPPSIPDEPKEPEEPPVVAPVRPPAESRVKVPGVQRREEALPPPVVTPAAGPPTGTTPPRKTLTERRRMIEDIRKRRAELVQSRLAPEEEDEEETPPTTAPNPAPVVRPVPSPADVPPLLEGAEMERQLQDYQMQAIREGRAPLPIPLSPEIDEQLVNEGYLPPAED